MKLLRPLLSVGLALAILAPAAAQASTPLAGVPTQIRRGFFTEMDLGTFFTTGGEPGVSNAQVYVSLGVGYDILSVDDHFLAVGMGFSLGTSAGSCFGTSEVPTSEVPVGKGVSDSATCFNPGTGEALAADWTAQTLEATVLYGFQIVPRLMLTARGLGGMAFIGPMAFADTENPVPLVGGGLGVEYATQFDHFSLGLDAAVKYFLGPNIPGFAIAPRVKYTF
ncbi:MAG TPA: adventurous gliding motility protein CglE [Vulgatibacter sp.]|nr:adventurous gliding motility protein CglE [Vulgatibacter sp.]